MCLKIVNFQQNKHALKPIQDLRTLFGPAKWELPTVINRIFISYH